jgi:hypothetical protein
VLFIDPRGTAALSQPVLQLPHLFYEEAHVPLARNIHDYFSAEKSAGSMNTDVTWFTIFPLSSESAETFFHSGSFWNSFQFFVASSRLGCAKM